MRAETLKGHLDGILLAVLEPGPRHGYAIMEALRIRSGGRVDLPTGTVYPALHRLERGLLRSFAGALHAHSFRATFPIIALIGFAVGLFFGQRRGLKLLGDSEFATRVKNIHQNVTNWF